MLQRIRQFISESFQTQDSLDYEKWSEQNAILSKIAKSKRRDDLHELAAVSTDPEEYESNYDATIVALEAGLRGTYRKAWNFIIHDEDDDEDEHDDDDEDEQDDDETPYANATGFIIGRTFSEVRKKLESLPNRI